MWPPEEHERLIENMSAWMDGELPDIASTPEAGGPDDLELEVAEHQACCPSCRDLFEELKELRAGFETLPEPDPPEGFAQGVLDRIREEARPKVIPLFKRPQVRALAGLAACLVLAVGLYHTARFSQKDTGEDFDWMVQSFSKDASDAVSGDPDTPQIAAYAAPEAPAASGEAADGISPRKISPKYSVGGAAVSSGTPEECAFQNDQYLWMAYDGDTPEPEARIIGSAQSLEDFLLPLPLDAPAEIQTRYSEAYFEAGRLLAVVVTEPSGSIRHQITQLTRGQVIIEQTSPYRTDDLAAWLILAEVDSTFQDGSELEVTVIPWEDHTNS